MILRACIVATSVLGFALGHVAAQSSLPPGFVYLRDVDPTIAQDIRYAGYNNFVGR
ncbi:MAG: peptidase M15, partial [Xanthobacteraceae bacterium]